MTDLLLDRETELETQFEIPKVSHIIDRGTDERPAEAIVLEARVNGTRLTALCGAMFVPTQNPENLPICVPCKEMLGFAMDFRGLLDG